MRRTLAILAVFAIGLAGCAPDAPTLPSAGAQKTGDFKQAKLDLAYSFLSDASVHNPTSKQLLTGALDAMKKAAKTSGGSDDVATPDFTTDTEMNLADFKRFAAAAGALAAKNAQLSADRLAETGVVGMMQTDPDCHTYYLDGKGGVVQSRPEQVKGSAPQIPAGGTFLQQQPDQAGLQAKLLDGGIAYVTWHAFEINGTYRVTAAVKAVLDKAVAAGAKAWLFDLRANVGGNGADTMWSWFLNGENTLKVQVKNGFAGNQSANKDLRLGPAYQLPIAIILNDRGGSAPEVFAAGMKENKRATIVGARSAGCLGGTSSTPLGSDGSQLWVVQEEYVGAVTGTKYNNVGIEPDVPADDASAIAAASKILLDKIAGK
ncbi:MAG: carboxyl-terminal processing protease [Chloroflexota bacterium]|nr:carboxyl-terminal processing protease [Chloroflexota bacterium]